MKNKFFTIYVLLLSCLILSSKTNAQDRTVTGGSTGGSDCIDQPPPTSFKRNNGGNGGNGTCGVDGQIRLKFKQDPSVAPILIGLLYQDGSPIDYHYLSIYGDISQQDSQHYISYCLPGGNIDPAKKVIAVFHYPGGCVDYYVGEE